MRLARGDEEALGRASTAGGLPAAVEATIVAVRTFLPELPYLPGWARTVETTPDRRFLVVASVTDPLTRTHRRGAAEGATPVEGGGPRHPRRPQPHHQPRPLTPYPGPAYVHWGV